MNEKSFFMVYIEGKGGPIRKHLTCIEAEEELTRLLLKPDNDGRTGYVLEAVRSVSAERIFKYRELNRS